MRFWKSKKITGEPRVGIGVATYLGDPRRAAALECLVHSMRAQTWPHWTLLLCHDGPLEDGRDIIPRLTFDRRVMWHETKKRKQQFGHPHRQWQLTHLGTTCDWLGLTNDDNYYAPVYLEWMLHEAQQVKHCDLVYCDMVRSHKLWKPFSTSPRRGGLDFGGWLASAKLCRRIEFDDFTFAGDGTYINRLRGSARGIRKVGAHLFVHN